MTQGLRLGFAGTPGFAAEHLAALLKSDHQVIAVWTQPDRPAGRGKKTKYSPVKELATSANLPIFQPTKLLSDDQQEMAALNLDLLVVVAYGLLLPQNILDTPKYGCINVHASLLPRWRGAAPIQRAVEAGDRETGICIMQMDAGLDTGDVLSRTAFPILPIDTAGTVHDRLIEKGAPLLVETLKQIEEQTGSLQPQDSSAATYAAKITKAEAEIDWSQTADEIDRKVRAFNPVPVAFTNSDGERIRIWEAYPLPTPDSLRNSKGQTRPGSIINGTEGVDVVCGDGVLRLKALQLPGKKPTPIADLLRGNADRFQTGVTLGSI